MRGGIILIPSARAVCLPAALGSEAMRDAPMRHECPRVGIRRGASCLPKVLLSVAVFTAGAVLARPCAAQLCVQLNGAAHIQDFNTLPVSGSSNNSNTLPIGFAFSESGPGNNITYAANDGGLLTVNQSPLKSTLVTPASENSAEAIGSAAAISALRNERGRSLIGASSQHLTALGLGVDSNSVTMKGT